MHRIVLDSTEEKIRHTLVSFASEYSRQIEKSITLRFTGGWVRDKLLGRTSHDIDIAIDSTTGQEFASALQEWIGVNGMDTYGVHTIARNPEKSKHLETATTRLMGLDVDFVNLRSEKYTNDSRIPVIEFGTPYEDAMRRDATLNALFYNLELQQVEDFTGRGLQDLEKGVLRTPLDPVETFRDDPLRVLRLIRFVGQLNFDLDPSVQSAMALAEIRSDLARKVSRERVGVELDKLLCGAYASKGLRYMVSVGVTSAVFTVPEPYEVASGHIPSFDDLQTRLDTTQKVIEAMKLENSQRTSSLWLATLLKGWEKIEFKDKKNKLHNAVYITIKEGIKLPSQKATLVTKLLSMAGQAQSLLDSRSRRDLGSFVRECGPDWELCLLYAGCNYDSMAAFSQLHDRILSYGLDRSYELKPLLKGSQIMKLFPGRKAGPWLNNAVKLQIGLQLENPNITHEEVEKIVKEHIKSCEK